MTLTPDQRHDLERLIEDERRRFARALADGVDTAHAARQLRALDAARARVDDGTFGRCEACGRGIELDRLIAHPTAVRCLACQEGIDQRAADPEP
ncbi:MAG: TraR/DksA C4-type zinc finger protein [Burkholderiales bacterium]|nr:TraR/DksA C4-type zinc finger protein [Burkholderiales bacterium]